LGQKIVNREVKAEILKAETLNAERALASFEKHGEAETRMAGGKWGGRSGE
jgi:hypothetical protein